MGDMVDCLIDKMQEDSLQKKTMTCGLCGHVYVPKCHECGGDWLNNKHKKGCSYECVACGDTGRNSKGGSCHPCVANGRLRKKRKTVRLKIKGKNRR